MYKIIILDYIILCTQFIKLLVVKEIVFYYKYET